MLVMCLATKLYPTIHTQIVLATELNTIQVGEWVVNMMIDTLSQRNVTGGGVSLGGC